MSDFNEKIIRDCMVAGKGNGNLTFTHHATVTKEIDFSKDVKSNTTMQADTGIYLDTDVAIKSVAKTCLRGRHVVAIQGRQGSGKSTLAKRIFTELTNQDIARENLMFIDEIADNHQLYNIVNLFYSVENGVLVFTDHNDSAVDLQRRILNALLTIGMGKRELVDKANSMLDIIIHVNNHKIDSYVDCQTLSNVTANLLDKVIYDAINQKV